MCYLWDIQISPLSHSHLNAAKTLYFFEKICHTAIKSAWTLCIWAFARWEIQKYICNNLPPTDVVLQSDSCLLNKAGLFDNKRRLLSDKWLPFRWSYRLFVFWGNAVFTEGKHRFLPWKTLFPFVASMSTALSLVMLDGWRRWQMQKRIYHLENADKQRKLANSVAVWQIILINYYF